MVKPSKSMQPEQVDLQKAKKRIGKGSAFGEDSFHNYMAVKIAMQRQQFGLVLPPPPLRSVPPSLSFPRPTSIVPKSPPLISTLKPPPRIQEDEDFLDKFETNPRTTSPNFSTPSARQLQAKPGDEMPVQQTKKKPESGSLAPPLNHTMNPCSSAPTVYKRPTLLERTSLAPLSRMAYPMIIDSPARPNFTERDDIRKDCAPSDRSVRFAEDIGTESAAATGWDTKRSQPKPKTKSKMESVISRLKKRHGRGNKRLDRKKAKKRKTEGSNYNQIKGDNATNIKTDMLPLEPAEQEDGLSELDKLFAMADDKDLKMQSKSDGHNNEIQEEKIETPVTTPVASILATEERKSTPIVGDGLAELDKIFTLGKAANDDNSHSTFHQILPVDDNQDNLEQQENSLTELSNIFSATEAANDEDPPFYLANDELEESSKSIIDLQPALDAMTANGSNSPASEDEAEGISMGSTTTASGATPSPKSIRRLRPDLFFYGVVVKIAGYTHPDNETIKRLLQKHGGDLETYETERVTHIIAEQLSMAKANIYKKSRRPRPVCRPSWIVDSVREGKLLPHGKYLLIENRDQHQMGIQTMFQKRTEATRWQASKPLTPHSSPQKPAVIQKNPYAKNKSNLQHPEKKDESTSLVEEAASYLSPVSHDHGSNRGILKSPQKIDKKFINGKIRTVGTDPDFLDSYFASSRLSFIGSFKQRTSSAHHFNDTGPSPVFSNSEKLIFHVDMDCFFASVVLRKFPQYQDKPVVISHHGNSGNNKRKDEQRGNNFNASPGHVPKNSSSECATCNYEARKYGIKKGMYLGRAKELCPEVIVLMYDFEGYEEVSQQVLKILDRLAASETHPGVVETVSCDEAYVELNFDSSEESEKLYDDAFQVAESIRNEIFDTTRCTASIGVGANKFLAKLGTDKAKPNKSYCVRDYRELLKGLKLRDVHGIGWRTEEKLMKEGLVTVQDVWDLGSRGETELIRILGPGTGKKIYQFTQGKDDRAITPVERKTIGAECNYGVRFDGPYGIDHFMEGLAKEVEKRMEGISLKGKKITLKIKQRKKGSSNKHKFLGHGSCHNLSKSTVIPGNIATRDSKIFKKIGLSLFREFAIADIHEIRGMGITISNLEDDNYTGKQTNTSGMQYWLHRSNEPETVNDSERTEEALTSKEFIAVETAAPNCLFPSTPKLDKNSEGGKREIVAEKEVRNVQSPLMIELPPMSQIQMSQVEALPPEFQQEVRSRMRKAGAGSLEEDDPGMVKERSIEKTERSRQFVGEESPSGNYSLLSTPQSIGKLVNSVQKDGDGEVIESIESPLLIELPPMSQIQMSQVEALPHELRQQIYSRMNRTTVVAEGQEIIDITDEGQPTNRVFSKHRVVESEQQHYVNRFRQTDLKRMMKLAAVRSGHESTNISLTQLEQLPLEIKLQVVNCDDRQIGILSQQVNQPAGFNDRPPRKSTANTANDMGGTSSKPRRTSSNRVKYTTRERNKTSCSNNNVTNATTAEKQKNALQDPRRTFRVIDRVDVWKEDLLPLKDFLNDNCPLRYPNSIEMVLEFLSIVLKEGRLPAMVSMIRCIRNRKDGWSKIEIIEKIARIMNDLHMERYGTSLDVSWLMGMEEY